MQLEANQDVLVAAEPIVRFVSKKFEYDNISASELERATARRAVEVAAWSVCVMPETADILNGSPEVRAEMLKLLDLEHEDFGSSENGSEAMETKLRFAQSIARNTRLYSALVVLAPEIAKRISYLVS